MKLESYADREFLIEETFEESEPQSRFPFEIPSIDEIKRVFVDGYYEEIARKAELDRIKRVAIGKNSPHHLKLNPPIGSSKAA